MKKKTILLIGISLFTVFSNNCSLYKEDKEIIEWYNPTEFEDSVDMEREIEAGELYEFMK